MVIVGRQGHTIHSWSIRCGCRVPFLHDCKVKLCSRWCLGVVVRSWSCISTGTCSHSGNFNKADCFKFLCVLRRRYLLNVPLLVPNSLPTYFASWDADLGTTEDIGLALFFFDGVDFLFLGVGERVRECCTNRCEDQFFRKSSSRTLNQLRARFSPAFLFPYVIKCHGRSRP